MITGYDTKSLSTMNYINKTPHLFCKSAKNFVCHLILRVKTSTSLNKIYWLCVFKKHWLLVKIPWSPSWISTFSATGLFNIHSVVIDEQWFICNVICNVNTVTWGENSLRYFGPIVWNTLMPEKLKNCDTLKEFKSYGHLLDNPANFALIK